MNNVVCDQSQSCPPRSLVFCCLVNQRVNLEYDEDGDGNGDEVGDGCGGGGGDDDGGGDDGGGGGGGGGGSPVNQGANLEYDNQDHFGQPP